MRKDFRVMFLYPNLMMMNMVPVSIAIFSAILKGRGFDVHIFDTTYYKTEEKSSDEIKVENLQLRPFNLAERGIEYKTANLYEDLRDTVDKLRPSLICLSVLEDTYPLGISLLNSIKEFKIPTIVGGIFATFATDKVIKEDAVNMVCIGEGEEAIAELCEKMADGKDYSNIDNIWIKKNGDIKKNKIRKAINLNNLPIPDFTIFEDKRLFRPMAGRVYRMLPVETHRGCPFACAFCNSPASYNFYKERNCGPFYRKKGVQKVYEELKYLVKRWEIEYVYFTADTFLAMSEQEFERFAEMYKEFKIPFWIQTRAETLSERRIEMLEEMNIHRMSIGLEHGNEKFRKEVINRRISNKRIIEAFRLLEDSRIPVTVNNIIGFPGETRELIFDTIKLNRQIKSDTTNAYAFVPYHGTPLRKLCLEKGYIDNDTQTACLTKDTVLNMPQLSRDEIRGLMRTFCLYVKMPESESPKIRIAERFDDEGNKMFEELARIYRKDYF